MEERVRIMFLYNMLLIDNLKCDKLSQVIKIKTGVLYDTLMCDITHTINNCCFLYFEFTNSINFKVLQFCSLRSRMKIESVRKCQRRQPS